MSEKKPFISVTATDCEWSYTRGTGAGGQKRNKTSSAVHCTHRASGAHGYSESSRSQLDNKRDAFEKMAKSDKFSKWLKMEIMRKSGELDLIEKEVDKSLRNVKIEVKIDDKWTEVRESELSHG